MSINISSHFPFSNVISSRGFILWNMGQTLTKLSRFWSVISFQGLKRFSQYQILNRYAKPSLIYFILCIKALKSMNFNPVISRLVLSSICQIASWINSPLLWDECKWFTSQTEDLQRLLQDNCHKPLDDNGILICLFYCFSGK